MARIGLNTFIQGLTGKLIIRWVKASAPLAEVDRLPAANFPYDAVDNLLDLDPVVYIVQWWRSDDGVSLDQLIKDWAIDASIYNEAFMTRYEYVVDRGESDSGVWADPVDLDTILTDTRLDGATKDELIVHEAGYGDHGASEYDLVAGGGIELLGGKTFDSGVHWFITRFQTVAQQISPAETSSKKYVGVAELNADRDFYVDSTDNLYNKLVLANWATAVGTVIFGDLALIPDGTHVTFSTEKGLQNYLTLQFDPGDTVRYLNQDVNVIHVPKCETISLYFFAGVCYVDDVPKRALQRGQLVPDYSTTRGIDTNALLLADEATGVLDGADYPGIYEFIQGLASGVVALGAGAGQWSFDSGGGVYPYKRNYGIDVGSGTFRVPHLAGMVVKLGSTSGTYEADKVGPHTVSLGLYYIYKTAGKGNLSVASQDAVAQNAGNRTNSLTINAGTGIDTETKVKSFSQIPYIYL